VQNSTQGSLLLGAISYGKLSFGQQEEGKNPLKNPVSYQLSYIVPPNKVEKHSVMYFFSLFCFICNGLRQFTIFFGWHLCHIWCYSYHFISQLMSTIIYQIPLTAWWGQGKRFFFNWHQDCFWTFRRRGKCGAAVKCVNVVWMFYNFMPSDLPFCLYYTNSCQIMYCVFLCYFSDSVCIITNIINWNTYLNMQRNIENLFNHSALNAANWALYMICLRNWFSIALPQVGIKQISIRLTSLSVCYVI